MKKIEIINNKLNVDLKPNDKILLQSKSGIAKFEYISRKNILYFTVSKFWFVKKGTATYLLGDD
jgi:hypothetical protein